MSRSTATSPPAAAPPVSEEAVDLDVVDRIVAERGTAPSATIPILQALQAHFRYLPRAALERVCQITEITPARIMGVATFYSQFRLKPVGRHVVSVCHGTACHVAGAQAITDALRRHLGLEGDEDTDRRRLFTLAEVACLGCCSLAPVMRVDDRVFGRLTPDSAPKMLEKFLEETRHPAPAPRRRPALDDAGGVEVRIGLGSCCIASGSGQVQVALEEAAREFGTAVNVRCGGCVGMCHRVPLVEVVDEQGRAARYGNVRPTVARNLLRRHLRPRSLAAQIRSAAARLSDLFTRDSAWESPDAYALDEDGDAVHAFLGKQKHIVLEGCGEMDPLSIEEYMARGGYRALERCVRQRSPEEVIQTVVASGLRGRGGAGFPTGEKWASVRRQPGPKKYVIVNGDEGDPGAFMDRMLLESYPHRVLEGLAIAAYAVGADEGYLYIRAEYPLAVERVRQAIALATERGFLGERVCGTDFGLHLHIMEGAGAFVCGEETGLIASIEGRRGMPSFRPPYPAQRGLWGRPTSVNNVETYATVPWIIRNGPEAFQAVGTETSKGTKVFALAGRIVRGGLIEVPMGITIGEIVEEIGGGIRDGRAFKAVQIGGPSGGCLPASLRDTRVDYEELTRTGAIMGSGGLVVMDDRTCMVDIARYFLQFTQNESCGKCTFCRVGTKRMLEILDRLCAGEGRGGDLTRLEDLARHVQRTSLCGLGQTAPNPVLTTLRYFREEYEAHIEGRCPARRCRALITYEITDECIGCTLCAQYCPTEAIAVRPYEKHEIDPEKCIRCGTCASVCPAEAVTVE